LALVDEVAFYRDLLSDLDTLEGELDTEKIGEPLTSAEEAALELLFRAHDVSVGSARVKVAVIGSFNAGKSSFINSLLGQSVCPVDPCPTTSSITRFHYSVEPRILCRDDLDSSEELISPAKYEERVKHTPTDDAPRRYAFEYGLPFKSLEDVELIDTPGFDNPKNPWDTEVTETEVRRADVLLVIGDINRGGVQKTTLSTIQRVIDAADSAPGLFLVLNRADEKSAAGRQRVKDEAMRGSIEWEECLLYSAVAKPTATTQDLEEALADLSRAFRVAVRDATVFEGRLAVEPERKRCSVVVGREQFSLKRRDATAGVSTREQILEMLHGIAKRKQSFVESGYERARRRHAVQAAAKLAAFRKAVDGEKILDINRYRRGVRRKFDKRFDRLTERLLELASLEAERVYDRAYWTRELDSGVFYKDAKISFSAAPPANGLADSGFWDEASRAVMSFARKWLSTSQNDPLCTTVAAGSTADLLTPEVMSESALPAALDDMKADLKQEIRDFYNMKGMGKKFYDRGKSDAHIASSRQHGIEAFAAAIVGPLDALLSMIRDHFLASFGQNDERKQRTIYKMLEKIDEYTAESR